MPTKTNLYPARFAGEPPKNNPLSYAIQAAVRLNHRICIGGRAPPRDPHPLQSGCNLNGVSDPVGSSPLNDNNFQDVHTRGCRRYF